MLIDTSLYNFLESLNNRGMIPTIQPEPDFFWTCGFCLVLDNVELIMHIKFQEFLMTGCRNMDTEHSKCPQNVFFHMSASSH